MGGSRQRRRAGASVLAITLLVAIAVIVGIVMCDRPTRSPMPVGDVPGPWHLILDSEFSGSSLAGSRWATGWFGSGVTEPVNRSDLECYDPAQVSVGGGTLNLTAVAKQERCGGIARRYVSGIATTRGKFSFSYGYVEARLWVPGQQEIADHPAFWAVGEVWPKDGEIDVFEGIAGRACVHFHNSSGAPGVCVRGQFSDGWHTYAADWEPGSITYYYDGRKVWRDNSRITPAPMYLVLDLAIGRSPSVTAPCTMRVDYVRVWQH
ncbi:MAG: glycoside hydrolase family 16 protein [Acidimicrobiales bacterium]